MKLMNPIALFALVNLSLAATGYAAEPIKIGLDVQFDNKDVESEARSYLSRELRSLSDVELVDSAAEIVIEVAGVGDDRIALSTTIVRVHTELLMRIGINLALQHQGAKKFERVITDEQWAFMKLVVGGEDVLGHRVNLTTRTNLKEACVRLVAHIDSESLQKQRDWRAEVKKLDAKMFGPPHN